MALGTALGMTGLIDDTRPSPPSLLPPVHVNYGQMLSQLPGQVGNLNSAFMGQYLNQAPQLAQSDYELWKQFAPQYAQGQYDIYNQFLPQYMNLINSSYNQANPQAAGIRSSLGNQIQEGLNAGGGLTDVERSNAEQSIRSTLQRQGRATGISSAFDESRFLGDRMFGRQQARQGAAFNYLNLRNPTDSFLGSINASALNPNVPSTRGLLQQVSPETILSQALQAKALKAQIQNQYNANRLNNFMADPNTYAENDLDKLYRLESSVQGIFSGMMGGGMLGGGGGGGSLPSSATTNFAMPSRSMAGGNVNQNTFMAY